MRRTIHVVCCGLIASSIALFPLTSDAVFPVAMLGKQILQNVIFGQVKDQMIGSLAGMGCKGARLAGLIASAGAAGSSLGGGGLSGGMPGGGMGGMPGGGMNLPGGMNMPGTGMTPPNGTNSPARGASMRAARGGIGIPNMTPEQAQALMANGMPDPAMLSQMTGRPMSPEQAAQMQQAMSGMQQAMSHPLSRAETLEVFNELADMGLMTDEMRGEVRDCITLAPAGSEQALGASGAMIKTMVLPQLRDTRQRLNNLTPEEQNQLADGLVDALQHASAKDRKAFLDGFGAGFYPKPVVETVRARMTAH